MSQQETAQRTYYRVPVHDLRFQFRKLVQKYGINCDEKGLEPEQAMEFAPGPHISMDNA